MYIYREREINVHTSPTLGELATSPNWENKQHQQPGRICITKLGEQAI